MSVTDASEPACELGYTSAQVFVMLGSSQARVAGLHEWMRDRHLTMVECRAAASNCGPHGSVIPVDVFKRFRRTGNGYGQTRP